RTRAGDGGRGLPYGFAYRRRRLEGKSRSVLAVHFGARERGNRGGRRSRRNVVPERGEGHPASRDHGRPLPSLPDRRGHALREPRVPRDHRRRWLRIVYPNLRTVFGAADGGRRGGRRPV